MNLKSVFSLIKDSMYQCHITHKLAHVVVVIIVCDSLV